MRPLQRLYDNLGNEVCLFPMEYMYLSQGEHQLYALDFLGWGASGRVYNCPCYAPFSGSIVYTGNDHNMIYWSDAPVRLVDGTLSDVSILVAHSMTPPQVVGYHFNQGDIGWYYSGNYGQSTGDHLHMEVALGHVMWDSTGYHLDNPSHMWNVMAVNDTFLINDLGFNWRNYEGGIVPPTPSAPRGRFPWVLYSRMLRDRRNV